MEKFKLELSPPLGEVSCLLTMPASPKAILTLAHGAGAGMEHPFMHQLANRLKEHEIATLRFNFPFIENKKKRPDVHPVAEKTIEKAIAYAHATFSLPLFCAGKSFGGRMTSQYLSRNCPNFVRGVIFYGFPLHPADKPDTSRATHLQALTIPMLFLQGTHDKLAYQPFIEPVCNSLATAQLVLIPDADHSFSVKKKLVVDELGTATSQWVDKQLRR